MNGFGLGLLCGIGIGIVCTAAYMFYGMTRPEFVNAGWAQAWQLFKTLSKWKKLVRDYDRVCRAWEKANEAMTEDVRVLMDMIVKEVEADEAGGRQ